MPFSDWSPFRKMTEGLMPKNRDLSLAESPTMGTIRWRGGWARKLLSALRYASPG